jgi:trk system potassium uptake protein TrkA
LGNGALELCVVKVRNTAKIGGKAFASGVYNHGKYRIVAIKRDQETIIPRGHDTVEIGDMVYCVCPKENMEYMREELGKSKREIKNVIFFGGDRIARKAATELTSEMSIKIIEKDRELCNILSDKVPDALIINDDGSDMSVLKEEGIQDADAFVAVTDSSEANIFACLAAKRFGVRKTIAEIENLDYIPMAEGLDIGTVLNKKTIAASYIYQMLLDASVRGVHNLTSADAEIVEFEAKEGSLVTKHKVKDLDLPDEANIGGIVRAGEGILVNGDTQIIAGDLVVLFCKSHVIRNLERFFK